MSTLDGTFPYHPSSSPTIGRPLTHFPCSLSGRPRFWDLFTNNWKPKRNWWRLIRNFDWKTRVPRDPTHPLEYCNNDTKRSVGVWESSRSFYGINAPFATPLMSLLFSIDVPFTPFLLFLDFPFCSLRGPRFVVGRVVVTLLQLPRRGPQEVLFEQGIFWLDLSQISLLSGSRVGSEDFIQNSLPHYKIFVSGFISEGTSIREKRGTMGGLFQTRGAVSSSCDKSRRGTGYWESLDQTRKHVPRGRNRLVMNRVPDSKL